MNVNWTELDRLAYEVARLGEQNRRLTTHNNWLVDSIQKPAPSRLRDMWTEGERYRELHRLIESRALRVECEVDGFEGTYDGVYLNHLLDRSRHGEIFQEN
jgi:hypothetical protein